MNPSNKNTPNNEEQLGFDFNSDIDEPKKPNAVKLLSADEFIDDIPYDSRFVSINSSNGKFMITALEHGVSLLKMKKKTPDFITQLQKTPEDEIPDKLHNLPVIEKLEKLRDLNQKNKISEILKKKDDFEKFDDFENDEFEDIPETPMFEAEPESNKKPLKMKMKWK